MGVSSRHGREREAEREKGERERDTGVVCVVGWEARQRVARS